VAIRNSGCHGETVAFFGGTLVRGSAKGADRVNVANLASGVNGRIEKISDPASVNLARFLQTVDQDANSGNGVAIKPPAHAIVGDRPIDLGRGDVFSLTASADSVRECSQDQDRVSSGFAGGPKIRCLGCLRLLPRGRFESH
jgi:histidine ammonia-lyase